MKKAGSLVSLLSVLFLFAVIFTIPMEVSSMGREDVISGNKEEKEVEKKKALNSIANMPLSFIENRGQFDSRVKFYSKTPSQTLWFTEGGIVFDLLKMEASGEDRIKGGKIKKDITTERLVFTQRLVGSTPAPRIEAKDPHPGAYNHFIGNNPEKWQKDMKAYKEILYHEVYPGIDMKLFGKGRDLEQEFHVKAGADVGVIRISYEGIEGLRVSDDGSLIISTGFGELKESRPTIYQEIEGKRVDIAGRFRIIEGTTYTIEPGPYNKQYALIIDPTLVYSTYIGGGNSPYGNIYGWDLATSITVDPSGNAYVTGESWSIDFPLSNPLQGANAGLWDVIVFKLSPDGSSLLYSTYIGGTGDDEGSEIAIDSSGNIYIVGSTDSVDFPVTANAFQTTNNAAGDEVIILKLDATGGSLLYSSYLGGSGTEIGMGLSLDTSNNMYITGLTTSIDLPLINPLYGSYIGGVYDAFVAKINPSLSGSASLIYSTYLGGTGDDRGIRISTDSSGNVWIVGSTSSTDFPMASPLYGTYLGGNFDVFLSKLSSDGSSLTYSTYLGGTGEDRGVGVVLDTTGNVYVTGRTTSTDFPVVNPIYSTYRGGVFDAFITKLNGSGSSIIYSTFIGGSGDDRSLAIALDNAGNSYITGVTSSTDFPSVNPIQPAYGGGDYDVFVTKVNSAGSSILYSTYLGGSALDPGWYGIGSEDAEAIAVDAMGNAYVAGFTWSDDFPIVNPYQATRAGDWDVFVAKISDLPPPIHIVWYDDSYGNNEIAMKTSTDGGATWTTQRLTNNTGNSYSPAISVDGSNLYVVWHDDTYGNYEILLKKSTDNGATWTFQRLTNTAGQSYNPSIAVNGSNIYVAWHDDTYGNNEILLKKSADGGATWATQRLTNNTGNSIDTHVAVDGNNIYVVWADDSYGNSEIVLKRSADGGATWTLQRLTNTTGYSLYPVVSVSGSNIYVVWGDDTYGNFEIFLKRSADGGATWAFQRITNNTGISDLPSMVLDGSNIYIVWSDGSYGNREIVMKRSADGGATWTTQRLTNTAGQSYNPSIEVDGSNIYIVWHDDTYGNNEIFLKRSSDNGATWSFQRLTNNTGTSALPVIAR